MESGEGESGKGFGIAWRGFRVRFFTRGDGWEGHAYLSWSRRDGSAEVGAGHEARGAAAHARDVALRGLPEVRLGRVASTRHDGAFVSTDYFLRGLR
jgi:hypothetical protein